jgi:hypothetical protein
MFTFVTDDGSAQVDATRDGNALLVDAHDVERAIGWELKPEGLCRGDVCVPVRDRATLVLDDRVDVVAVARALRAPFVADEQADVAVLGASAADRAGERQGMKIAPDLVLRDLDGNAHQWSALGRKKKLLFAWASW